jgi:hypothetical protein
MIGFSHATVTMASWMCTFLDGFGFISFALGLDRIEVALFRHL